MRKSKHDLIFRLSLCFLLVRSLDKTLEIILCVWLHSVKTTLRLFFYYLIIFRKYWKVPFWSPLEWVDIFSQSINVITDICQGFTREVRTFWQGSGCKTPTAWFPRKSSCRSQNRHAEFLHSFYLIYVRRSGTSGSGGGRGPGISQKWDNEPTHRATSNNQLYFSQPAGRGCTEQTSG